MSNSNVYLSSKPRYEILDGLRGVAAMLVVAYHLFETYYHSAPNQPVNHGYLAVDFFFVLSGFVIGYAYDDRWDRMSTWSFIKRRLIRLHPMVIFGTFIGALLFYFGQCSAFPLISSTPWYILLMILFWCFTMIPVSKCCDIRGWTETNPLNGPAWSLQWEYVANLLYALVIRRLSKFALMICVALFAVLTLILCLDLDVFGFLAARSYASYTVIGGWSLTPDQLQIGLTRLLYPFFCGLLISRLGFMIKVKGGFWWCAALLALLLAMPWMGTGEEAAGRMTNGIYEAVCILVLFPLIVVVGAGSSVLGSKSQKINRLLGEISYPLYITHYPLIYMQMAWAEHHADQPASTHVFVSVSIFILALFLAYAASRLYDLPVRQWLRRKCFKPA